MCWKVIKKQGQGHLRKRQKQNQRTETSPPGSPLKNFNQQLFYLMLISDRKQLATVENLYDGKLETWVWLWLCH